MCFHRSGNCIHTHMIRDPSSLVSKPLLKITRDHVINPACIQATTTTAAVSFTEPKSAESPSLSLSLHHLFSIFTTSTCRALSLPLRRRTRVHGQLISSSCHLEINCLVSLCIRDLVSSICIQPSLTPPPWPPTWPPVSHKSGPKVSACY